MEEIIEKICIVCPAGCHLKITRKDSEITVEGNHCPGGQKYAIQEMTDPRRTVTAVVPSDREGCYIPVKTLLPLPKTRIPALLRALEKMQITLPVCRGDILLRDFEGTGVDVAVTRTMNEKGM